MISSKYMLLAMAIIIHSEPNIQVQHVQVGQSIFLKCFSITEDKRFQHVLIRWIRNNNVLLKIGKYQEYISPEFRNRVYIHDHFTIRLESVRSEDRGIYKCEARIDDPDQGEIVHESQIFLNVRESPVITDPETTIYVVRQGSPVKLLCNWAANPRPNVTWTRGAQNSPRLTEQLNVDNGTGTGWIQTTGRARSSILVLEQYSRIFADAYHCHVRNALGSATKSFVVHEEGQMTIIVEPASISVAEGVTTVRFDCQVALDKTVILNFWSKTDVNSAVGVTSSNRYVHLANGSLIIYNVTVQDGGLYRCIPLSAHSGVQIFPSMESYESELFYDRNPFHSPKSALLTVICRPETTIFTQSTIYMGLNGPGLLPCTIIAWPNCDSIQWRKVPFKLTEIVTKEWKRSLNLYLNPQSTLFMYAVPLTYYFNWTITTKSDEGWYECRARNRLGWGNWSEKVRLQVGEYPRLIRFPPKYVQVRMGDTILLSCHAEGVPNPVIRWIRLPEHENADLNQISTNMKKDTSEIYDVAEDEDDVSLDLPMTASLDNNGTLNFSIRNISDTIGFYYCLATNEIGTSFASCKLNLVSQPSDQAVFSLRLDVVTYDFWAHISWGRWDQIYGQSPAATDEPCHSTVYYKLIRTMEPWISLPLQPSTTQSFWLSVLIPNEHYLIRVKMICGIDGKNFTSPSVYAQAKSILHVHEGSPPLQHPVSDVFGTTGSKFEFDSEPTELILQKKCSPTLEKLRVNSCCPLLSWTMRTSSHRKQPLLEVVYYIVEYRVNWNEERTMDNWTQTWSTFAPIRAPKKSLEFNCSHSHTENSTSRSNLAGRLIVRIREFTPMYMSKPSEELIVTLRSNDLLTNALSATLEYENSLVSSAKARGNTLSTQSETVYKKYSRNFLWILPVVCTVAFTVLILTSLVYYIKRKRSLEKNHDVNKIQNNQNNYSFISTKIPHVPCHTYICAKSDEESLQQSQKEKFPVNPINHSDGTALGTLSHNNDGNPNSSDVFLWNNFSTKSFTPDFKDNQISCCRRNTKRRKIESEQFYDSTRVWIDVHDDRETEDCCVKPNHKSKANVGLKLHRLKNHRDSCHAEQSNGRVEVNYIGTHENRIHCESRNLREADDNLYKTELNDPTTPSSEPIFIERAMSNATQLRTINSDLQSSLILLPITQISNALEQYPVRVGYLTYVDELRNEYQTDQAYTSSIQLENVSNTNCD